MDILDIKIDEDCSDDGDDDVFDSAGGQGSPADALQLIVSQSIDSVLMKLSAAEIVRIQEQLTVGIFLEDS